MNLFYCFQYISRFNIALFSVRLVNYDQALAFSHHRRNIRPAVYNQGRLFENPIPNQLEEIFEPIFVDPNLVGIRIEDLVEDLVEDDQINLADMDAVNNRVEDDPLHDHTVQNESETTTSAVVHYQLGLNAPSTLVQHHVTENPSVALALVEYGSNLFSTGKPILHRNLGDNIATSTCDTLSDTHPGTRQLDEISENELDLELAAPIRQPSPSKEDTSANTNSSDLTSDEIKREIIPIRRISSNNYENIFSLFDRATNTVMIDEEEEESMIFDTQNFPKPKQLLVDSRMIKRQDDTISGSKPYFETVIDVMSTSI